MVVKPRKKENKEAKFIYFDYASDILSLCLRRSCLKHQFCSIYPGSQLWYRARVSILARLIFGAGSFFLPYIIDVSSIPGLYPPDTIVSVFIPDLWQKCLQTLPIAPRVNYHPSSWENCWDRRKNPWLKIGGLLALLICSFCSFAIGLFAQLKKQKIKNKK